MNNSEYYLNFVKQLEQSLQDDIKKRIDILNELNKQLDIFNITYNIIIINNFVS